MLIYFLVNIYLPAALAIVSVHYADAAAPFSIVRLSLTYLHIRHTSPYNAKYKTYVPGIQQLQVHAVLAVLRGLHGLPLEPGEHD